MIPWLNNHELTFPAVETALDEPNGLLAVGGDLSQSRLLLAYSLGIFPWFSKGEPILWWSPPKRMVVFPHALRITRSLAKTLRNKSYEIRVDTAFRSVIEACALPRSECAATWITSEMIEAYCCLFAAGFAHSFETWVDGVLVGGLYGVGLGRMFYGESMFSIQKDASKLAFVHMVQHLGAHGVSMIDCQMYTPHLASLGACQIVRQDFIVRLKEQVTLPEHPHVWRYHHISSKRN